MTPLECVSVKITLRMLSFLVTHGHISDKVKFGKLISKVLIHTIQGTCYVYKIADNGQIEDVKKGDLIWQEFTSFWSDLYRTFTTWWIMTLWPHEKLENICRTAPPLVELSPCIINTSGYMAFLFHFVVKKGACSLIIFTHYLNARVKNCVMQCTTLFLFKWSQTSTV